MKVLMIIASMNPDSGGPCQAIRNFIPELEKLDVHNEVVCLDDPAASFLNQDPFIIHALGPGKSSWNYSPRLIPWLLENFSRFDAVIVHGLWLYNGYAVQKAVDTIKKQQIKARNTSFVLPKIYVMPHGMLDPYFQRASGRKLKALRNWLYWKLIEAKLVNESTGILFTCEAELELARLPFRPYMPKHELNVGFGIEKPPAYQLQMRQAFSQQCPELNDHSYFLFLSRIHQKKGVDLLLEAYAAVRTKWISENRKLLANGGIRDNDESVLEMPKLVIAGPGRDTVYGLTIQKMVAENSVLSGAVFFTGMLSGNTKWGAFYGCDVFILPSHQENFGIAVVEALSCSKPVLISNQINIWKEVYDSGAGLIADDTVAGTQNLVEKWLMLSHTQKSEMRQAAKTLYTNNFAIQGAAANFANAIQ